jgi:hypothetical protein
VSNAHEQVAALVFRHSGVEIRQDERYEVAMPKVLATMEYLASMASAGNALACALEKGDVDEAVAQYIRDAGRAVQARVEAMGLRPLSGGACRFEIG